jgi:UDPglucose 6-dehydrogenase
MNETRRIAVVGCGHVGTVMAASLAELGHQVVGVDVDAALVEELNGSRVRFIEPGLTELVVANSGRGRLRFTTSYPEALDGAEFVFLCVNTPSTSTGAADLRYVRRAVAQIAEVVLANHAKPLIVNKSTSPIGTGETIEAILARTFPSFDKRPEIVANPEFLREGHGVYDFFHPERIVVGADRRIDAERVAALYQGIDAPVVLTDLRTAEMIKYVSNAFLATKVSFINEIARLCENLGVDIDMVVQGISLDPRIGNTYLNPGIGYGGSCLPKDVAALCHSGDSVGITMRVLAAVQDVNMGQRKHAVNSIRRALGPLEGKTIAAWGVTFKGGSEDTRESPALDIISLLRNEGARVNVHDPSLKPDETVLFADLVGASPIDSARNAECVAILTDWPEFAEVDLHELASVMQGKLIYDGRNLLDRRQVEAAGLQYHGVGRAPRPEPLFNARQ